MKEIEYKFILTNVHKNTLEKFLQQNKATLVSHGTQDNWYYVAPGKNDLRIRRTNKEAYLVLKKGWMHDDDRDEIEIKVARADFMRLDEVFRSLGYEYDTKWYRKRTEYKYKNFAITIDFNAGYGWVAEIERTVQPGHEDIAKKEILALAAEIGITPASKTLFDKMYQYYKKNWSHYIKTKSTFDIDKIK